MGLLLQRALLGALGAVAPRTAARRAATLFSTPRRRVATRTPRPEPAWIDAAGFRLAVYGRGPGAPVLLAHGWEGSAHDLAPIGDALAAALLAPPRHPEAHLRAFTRALGMNAVRHAGVRRELERRVGPVERFDSGLAARALAVPGLVIHDLGDRQVPFEDGVAIAEAWAGSELRAVEGLGHRRILRDERVAADVVRFVLAHGVGAVPPSGGTHAPDRTDPPDPLLTDDDAPRRRPRRGVFVRGGDPQDP